MAHALTVAGLAVEAVGVVIIFIWGPPQPDFSESVHLALQSRTVLRDGTKVADIIAATKRKKLRHAILSRMGLGLIFVGISMQGWDTWHQGGITGL
jgi:hypothetical protein